MKRGNFHECDYHGDNHNYRLPTPARWFALLDTSLIMAWTLWTSFGHRVSTCPRRRTGCFRGDFTNG